MQVLERFNSTIRGTFFGHTHDDEIRVYYKKTKNGNKPIAAGLVGGSLTTYGHVNPCYKIYSTDNQASAARKSERDKFTKLKHFHNQ